MVELGLLRALQVKMPLMRSSRLNPCTIGQGPIFFLHATYFSWILHPLLFTRHFKEMLYLESHY